MEDAPSCWMKLCTTCITLIHYYADRAQSEEDDERFLVHSIAVFIAIHGNTMKWDTFFHAQRFLNVGEKRNEPNNTMNMAKENENYIWHYHRCIRLTPQPDRIYAISEIIVVFTAELYSKSIYQRNTTGWDKHIESLWFQGILHEVWPYMVKTGNRSQLQWQLFM